MFYLPRGTTLYVLYHVYCHCNLRALHVRTLAVVVICFAFATAVLLLCFRSAVYDCTRIGCESCIRSPDPH